MSRLSIDRVVAMTIGGAVGGFLTYLIVDPSMRAQEETIRFQGRQLGDIGQAFGHVFLMGALIGGGIGAALILAEELLSGKILRLVRGVLLGLVIGGVIGSVGTIFAALLFATFVMVGLVVVGRALGWALMGAAAGLCPGIVAGSPQRVRQGILGGLIGGGAGGLLFDLLAAIMGSGSVSRMVGFVLMGAAIGAAVSLVEEFGKEYWLTALSGAKEGRSYILSKSETALGRDELTDIPLFGDPTVLKRHARIAQGNNTVTIMAEPGAAVTINHQTVAGGPLSDGDIVTIGRHHFRFRARRATQAALVYGPQPAGAAMPSTPSVMPANLQSLPLAMTQLEVVAGPHTGAVFPITPGAILGRDPRCDIPLIHDSRVSRQHARLAPDTNGWRIEDGGSTNGLYLNGMRVVNERLHPGDQIGIGESILRVC
jgi:pSer/pThr/pTyr-binding forkhead associated (FHA) protein